MLRPADLPPRYPPVLVELDQAAAAEAKEDAVWAAEPATLPGAKSHQHAAPPDLMKDAAPPPAVTSLPVSSAAMPTLQLLTDEDDDSSDEALELSAIPDAVGSSGSMAGAVATAGL